MIKKGIEKGIPKSVTKILTKVLKVAGVTLEYASIIARAAVMFLFSATEVYWCETSFSLFYKSYMILNICISIWVIYF